MKIPFFSTPQSHELAVIIDIGSGVVSGAIVSLPKGGDEFSRPTFFYQTSHDITCHGTVTCEPLKKSMLSALGLVVNDLARAHVGIPARLYCVLASPWCISQTRIVTLKKIMPFKISSEAVVSLVEKEKKLFGSYVQKQLTKDESIQSPLVIETMILSMICDGVTLYELPKHSIASLELSVAMTVSDQHIIDEIQEIIDTAFAGKEVLYHSFTTASFCVARDLLPHKKNILIIDIGGEVSDISYGKNDVLLQSISIPFGTHTLMRKAIEGGKVTMREFKSLVRMHKSKLLHANTNTHMNILWEQLGIAWKKEFKNAIKKLSIAESLDTMIVFADGDTSEWFTDRIREVAIESSTPVVSITPISVYDRYASAENVTRDIYTITDALFLVKRNM
jgi:hypothetical protein